MTRLVLRNATNITVINKDAGLRGNPQKVHCAPGRCSESTIDFVIGKGSDLVLKARNQQTWKALPWVVIEGHEPMVRFFLDRGTNEEIGVPVVLHLATSAIRSLYGADAPGGNGKWWNMVRTATCKVMHE